MTPARISSRAAWPGGAMIGSPARVRTRSKASWMASPTRIGPWALAIDAGLQRLDGVDVAVVANRVEELVPRRDEAVEEHERLLVEVLRQVLDVVDGAGGEGGEGVDRPQHAGLLVEEAAGGGAVEDRRQHEAQATVAGVEVLAGLAPDHALEVHRPLEGQALGAEEVHDERRLGRRLEHLVERAGVVAVLVGEEHPADVVGVDEAVHHLEPVLAVHRGAGVDDDRLLAEDHQRVHRHVGAGLGGGQVGDQVGVGRHLHGGGGGDRGCLAWSAPSGRLVGR